MNDVPVGQRPQPAAVDVARDPADDHACDHLAALIALAAQAPTAWVLLRVGDLLRLVGAYGAPPDALLLRAAPLSSTLAGVIFASGTVHIVDDVHHDANLPADAPIRLLGIGAYLGCPVRDRNGDVVGICAATDPQPRRWRSEQVAAVEHAAAFLAASRRLGSAETTP
ncbi:GAF domain-containing protein [Pilimelia columellifera]|uniref:GAF domain-containing protein n=1 Tax=Pilimelia columellifera TaxID=706574 RepID=UPI0031DAD624